MKNVIERLIKFSKEIKLNDRFNYTFELSNTFFNQSEINELIKSKNAYEQNVNLKWILKEKYISASDLTEIDFWIINTWGGIRGFKENSRNIDKIQAFKKQLKKRRLTLDSFSTISSLSKLSSFLDPDSFVIYDSRVIYALNYLILTCENQNGFKEKYFPMPSGRNRIIENFDIKTIINIMHIDKYGVDNDLFVTRQQAYFDFCDFVKTNAKNIYGLDAKPYELEMLLFTLADKEIFTDLKDKIIITTTNNVYSA